MNHPKRVTDYDRAVSTRVRERRVRAGITQSAIAQHLGVTFQQLQKMEHGVNRISAGRLVQIAEVLNANPAEFLAVDAHTSARSDESMEIAAIIDQLPPDLRGVCVHMFRATVRGLSSLPRQGAL